MSFLRHFIKKKLQLFFRIKVNEKKMKTNLSVYLSKRQTYKYTIHNCIAVKEVRKRKDGIIIAHAQYVSVCQKRKDSHFFQSKKL